MRDIKDLIGSTPADLKDEWEASGKVKTKKCMERM
jgi:hypothetical protein